MPFYPTIWKGYARRWCIKHIHPTKACLLSAGYKHLGNNPLYFVQENEADIQLNTAVFACCEGTGRFFESHTHTVTQCSLLTLWQRFHIVYSFAKENFFLQKPFLSRKDLLISAVQLFGTIPQSPGENQSGAAMLFPLEFRQGRVSQVSSEESGKLFSCFALLLTWYRQHICWFVRFGVDSCDKIIPQILKTLGTQPLPIFIIVVGISKLWDETQLFELETLLSFADQHNFPIFLEFLTLDSELKSGKSQNSARPSLKFHERLKIAQSKSIGSFLSPRILSLMRGLDNGPFF